MAITTEDELTPERFAALLESYGGDVDRWPPTMRSGARALLAQDATAARQQQEATALDRLLALAPVTAASDQLVEQIVAKALAERSRPLTVRATGGNVVAIPTGRDRAARSNMTITGSASWRLPRQRLAGAGGMMAASLLIGVWLGASGTATQNFAGAFQGRQSAALEAMSEIVQSALPLDLLEAFDEDTL